MDTFIYWLGLQAEAVQVANQIASIFAAGIVVFVGIVCIWVVLCWHDSEA